ncbi:MAG: hypothetical protein ACI3U2_12335, partial [Anaerovibrio sp.]
AEPTTLFIERPSFRIIDNGIFIPRPPRRHNPATLVLYHVFSKSTIYKFCKMLASILAVAGLASLPAPLFRLARKVKLVATVSY